MATILSQNLLAEQSLTLTEHGLQIVEFPEHTGGPSDIGYDGGGFMPDVDWAATVFDSRRDGKGLLVASVEYGTEWLPRMLEMVQNGTIDLQELSTIRQRLLSMYAAEAAHRVLLGKPVTTLESNVFFDLLSSEERLDGGKPPRHGLVNEDKAIPYSAYLQHAYSFGSVYEGRHRSTGEAPVEQSKRGLGRAQEPPYEGQVAVASEAAPQDGERTATPHRLRLLGYLTVGHVGLVAHSLRPNWSRRGHRKNLVATDNENGDSSVAKSVESMEDHRRIVTQLVGPVANEELQRKRITGPTDLRDETLAMHQISIKESEAMGAAVVHDIDSLTDTDDPQAGDVIPIQPANDLHETWFNDFVRVPRITPEARRRRSVHRAAIALGAAAGLGALMWVDWKMMNHSGSVGTEHYRGGGHNTIAHISHYAGRQAIEHARRMLIVLYEGVAQTPGHK